MTFDAYLAQQSWLPTVVGLQCASVDVDDEAGRLTLLFGEVEELEDDALLADRAISITGVWRVERGEAIWAGSGDQDLADRFERLQDLIGEELLAAEADPVAFDLMLRFSGELIVRCFPCEAAQFEDDLPDDEAGLLTAWWIDGRDMPEDWEAPNPNL